MPKLKSLVVPLVVATGFTFFGSSFAFAESNSTPADSNPDQDISIQSSGIGVPVPKPIKAQGVLSNNQLKSYVDYMDKTSSRLSRISWLANTLSASVLVGAVGGGVETIAGSMYNSTTRDQFLNAYNRGQSMYWVECYASGVANSLSVIEYHDFSSTSMHYFYDK